MKPGVGDALPAVWFTWHFHRRSLCILTSRHLMGLTSGMFPQPFFLIGLLHSMVNIKRLQNKKIIKWAHQIGQDQRCNSSRLKLRCSRQQARPATDTTSDHDPLSLHLSKESHQRPSEGFRAVCQGSPRQTPQRFVIPNKIQNYFLYLL